jgi:tungstate transport system substrate-binding protein
MHHLSLAPRALRRAAAPLVVAGLLLLAACTPGPTPPSSSSTESSGTKTATSDLVLASTTSTQDSGLFGVLIPAFEKDDPQYKVKVVAVGSGEAIKLGEKKDADVLLVHSPAAEKKFVADGFGGPRTDVMYNQFLIVGPASDPAGVKGTEKATDAFKKIAAAGHAGKTVFVARGDNSGTSTKEMSIWTSASVEPTRTNPSSWYLSTGQGMGEVLKLTSEKQGYTLADEATFLSMKDALKLEILSQGDKKLFNQYGVIPVAGAKNEEGAKAFAAWITGPKGQAVIASYGVEDFGKPLFTPNSPK